MGLTVFYNWKIKADARTARRLVQRFHGLAMKLPEIAMRSAKVFPAADRQSALVSAWPAAASDRR
jgi:hypothetical protein